MREIKFRARRQNTDEWDEWVYGTYYKDKDGYFMVEEITGSHIKIIPDTIGQLTGLKDKNNKEIYEGDIIEYYLVTVLMVGEEPKKETQVIKYDSKYCSFRPLWHIDALEKIKVIGNIYENPELIVI